MPGTRFAVDAYVHFVREKTLLEAIASSLTELFSPVIIGERMDGMLKNYDFVTARDARLFRQAPAAGRARRRFRARLRQAARQDAGAAAGRARRARIQVRRAVGDAGRALSRLCGARATCRPAPSCRTTDELTQSDAQVADTRNPRLPRGVRLVHNEAQGGWVLLAPERVFKADAIAAEILKRCTGEATFAAIVDDLAKTFNAPRERSATRAMLRAWPTSAVGIAWLRTSARGEQRRSCWSCRVSRASTDAQRSDRAASPLGLLAELTHRCPLGCPYCSNPLALEPRADELDTATWARVFREAAGARRAAGASVRRRAGCAARSRRDHGGRARGRPLHQSDHVGGRHHAADAWRALADAGLDHVQISIQDSEPNVRRPYRRL